MVSQLGLSLIEQYKIIHKRKRYGTSSSHKAIYIAPFVDFRVDSLLDYGCGRSGLAHDLGRTLGCKKIYLYDPAIEKFNKLPRHVDLITCTEVLEHIPECDLIFVFNRLKSISERCFFGVCTRIAAEILPNGINAHVTVKPVDWWVNMMKNVFETVIVTLITKGEGFHAKTW